MKGSKFYFACEKICFANFCHLKPLIIIRLNIFSQIYKTETKPRTHQYVFENLCFSDNENVLRLHDQIQVL